MTKYVRKGRKRAILVRREGDIYAIIYTRVSSDRQAIEGNGLGSQQQRCREYVKAHNYILLEDHLFEDTASGKGSYTTRPGQVEIISLIDKNPHRNYVLVIDDVSRLARNVNAHFEFRDLLAVKGIKVESPNFDFSEEPEGRAMEGITAVFSQYHRESNERQVRQKMRARLMDGDWPFAPRIGYTSITDPVRGGKVSIPHKQKGPMLKTVLEGFADGTYVRKIDACKALVDLGLWEKQRPEKYIHRFTEILIDPFYAGDVEYMKDKWEVSRRKGRHQGLISYETFDLIQKRLASGDKVKRIRRDTSSEFPLRGLLKCECCGRNITAAWTNKKRGHYGYYYCQNPECEFYGKMSKMADVESGFKEVLEKSRLKPEVGKLVEAVFVDAWEEEMSSHKAAELTRTSAITQLETREQELAKAAIGARNESLKRSFENQLEKVSDELKSLKEEASPSKIDLDLPYKIAIGKAMKLIESPYSVWEMLDVYEK